MHSRNRTSRYLNRSGGKTLDEALNTVGMAVEGVKTCQAAYKLAKRLDVEMPITEQLYYSTFEEKSPEEAVEDLMLRSKTFESEEGLNQ